MDFTPNFPVPSFPPLSVEYHAYHLKRLENAMGATIGVLRTLLQKLDSRLGPDFLGEHLEPLLGIETIARAEVARIEELVRQGKKPAAVRLYREITGLTWDDALAAIGSWTVYSVEQKVNFLQQELWIKAVSGSNSS